MSSPESENEAVRHSAALAGAAGQSLEGAANSCPDARTEIPEESAGVLQAGSAPVPPTTPLEPQASARGAGPKTRRTVNVPLLAGSLLGLAAVLVGSHFLLAYQVHRNASQIKKHADALAEEQNFASAAANYTRYLQLCPEDGNARFRLAEMFEKIGGASRAIELYQETLSSGSSSLAPDKRVQAQRRVTELLLESGNFDAAKTEAKTVVEMEGDTEAKKVIEEMEGDIPKGSPTSKGADHSTSDIRHSAYDIPPQEWRGRGFIARALAGQYLKATTAPGSSANVSSGTKTEAFFKLILKPDSVNGGKVYVAPEVYLARYDYRLLKGIRDAKDLTTADAYVSASSAAMSDLEEALKLAPENPKILRAAASAFERIGLFADRALGEGSARGEDVTKARAAAYAQAADCYSRAAKADSTDPQVYLGLGRVYSAQGNEERAILTWQHGLKEVKSDAAGVDLDVVLASALIQQGRLAEAEKVLKDLDEILPKLVPQSRMALQRQVDLSSAKLAFRRNRFDEAIRLLTDMASGKAVQQDEKIGAAQQTRYEALCLIGDAHAGLQKADLEKASQSPNDAAKPRESAQGHLRDAVSAFEQAALLAPREAAPHLAAAEACRAGGDRDAAIAHYEQALQVVSAMKAPPAARQIGIYNAMIALCDEDKKRASDAEHYRERLTSLIAESTWLTLVGVNQAIREGKPSYALALRNTVVRHGRTTPRRSSRWAEQSKPTGTRSSR